MGLATFKRCRHQAESGSYGKWPVPWDLPLLFFLSGKSHGTCHFPMVSTPAESGSYGEWQDSDLATFRASRDRADLGSYGKWQDPDLATFKASRDRADLGSYGERQDPDLATFRGVDNGKIWILPLLRVSRPLKVA